MRNGWKFEKNASRVDLTVAMLVVGMTYSGKGGGYNADQTHSARLRSR